MRKALIAGGGIAGMAAALALAREGWTVTLCEAAPAPGEVGAGLQISPNAAKVLRWLGVLDRVSAGASVPEAAELRDGLTGARVYRAALGKAAEARWGAPYLHVHRADLLAALTDAAHEAGAEIRGGARVDSYVIRPEGPALKLEDGSSLGGDLVIGADGIRSSLRAQINGAEAPDFTGQVAWRGTIPADRLPDGLVERNATVWAGPGRHLVTYYLRGGKAVNFVAVEERAGWVEEGWSAEGNAEDIRAAFAGWHERVTGLVERIDDCFLWGLFTRPEQVRWVDGPVVLIGDSAHPMLPFMAQGAAMALEDVAVLVRELQSGQPLAEATLAHESRRWPRVARVQARSLSNSRLFHQLPGLRRRLRWGAMSALTNIAPGVAAGQLDWLYDFDATAGL